MKYCITIVLFFLAASCKQHDAAKFKQLPTKRSPFIVLQPLGTFSYESLNFLKDSIAKFYPVKIIVGKEKALPLNAWHEPRKRWIADSIIAWLRTSAHDSIRLTVGLIEADISTKKGSINNYGVMGLGYQPGKACVVSSFRLKKNIYSEKQFHQRLFKVVAHEMGHNFGLPHCSNQQCIMVDAEGKMKLEGEKDLCAVCKQKIKSLF